MVKDKSPGDEIVLFFGMIVLSVVILFSFSVDCTFLVYFVKRNKNFNLLHVHINIQINVYSMFTLMVLKFWATSL